jgi:hypothetical protein
MSMNMEKRSSAGNVDHNESADTIGDQTKNEQPSEKTVSSDSTSKPATTTANESANEQPPKEPVSSDLTSKPATTTANESANKQPLEESVSRNSTKNPAAVSLGRLGGLKGGKARAKTLTKSERSNIARKAAMARWRKKKQT